MLPCIDHLFRRILIVAHATKFMRHFKDRGYLLTVFLGMLSEFFRHQAGKVLKHYKSWIVYKVLPCNRTYARSNVV